MSAVTTIARRGLMLVLSSPSGAGKTSISRALLQRDDNLSLSISVTTRGMRPGEAEGRDYYFISRERYDAMVSGGELLEHARVFDHYYGTPRAPVEKSLGAGHDVLFDIDWQGTQQLREAMEGDLVSVFILPPSAAALEERLRRRAQDSDAVIAGRMAKAGDEISHWSEYDYIIVNRDFEASVGQVQAILTAERLRRQRQRGLTEFVRAIQSEL